jgi:hypothetical protein
MNGGLSGEEDQIQLCALDHLEKLGVARLYALDLDS